MRSYRDREDKGRWRNREKSEQIKGGLIFFTKSNGKIEIIYFCVFLSPGLWKCCGDLDRVGV